MTVAVRRALMQLVNDHPHPNLCRMCLGGDARNTRAAGPGAVWSALMGRPPEGPMPLWVRYSLIEG